MSAFPFSNFEPCPLVLDSVEYPTLEHAYQAAKTDSLVEREAIRLAATPGQAKRLGRGVTLRPDWGRARLTIMATLLIAKFSREPWMSRLAAFNGPIVETNTWHDIYWGCCVCPRHAGQGENHLGLLLEALRTRIQGAPTGA